MGRERRLRPEERDLRAREAKANSGCPAYWDHPCLIRPPRTTAGPPKGWKRIGRRPARLTCARAESSDRPGPVRRPDRRQERSASGLRRRAGRQVSGVSKYEPALASCSPASLFDIDAPLPGNARGIRRARNLPVAAKDRFGRSASREGDRPTVRPHRLRSNPSPGRRCRAISTSPCGRG